MIAAQIEASTPPLASAEPTDATNVQPFTAEEVAELVRVNVKTIAAHAARGKIPGRFTIGRRVFFRRSEILAWLTTGATARQGRAGR